MNDNTHTPTPLTLDDIARQKEQLQKAIARQKQLMTDLTRSLVAPLAPAANKTSAVMRAFNTGMAIFDGAMLGLKLMRRLRKFLKRY